MTANDLIAAFETLADAPDGVKRLRELVLQLAVRGKLVPQNLGDEPAQELLRRVVSERSAAGGRASKGGSVAPNDIPFEVPTTWAWVRFGDIFECRLGKMLDKAKNRGSLHPYLRNANVRWGSFDLSDVLQMRLEEHEVPDVSVRKGDLVICEGGEPGRSAVWESEAPFVIQKALHRARPYLVDSRYYQVHLRVDCASGRIAELFTGATIMHFTGQVLDRHIVTLPPLAEQHRIVARVDELMDLLDRLEAARTARDDVRRAARDAALAALRDAEDSDAVEAAWGRIAGQMDALFAEPEDVGPLRQAIREVAIHGRLVAQDPHDEPARKLMERIEAIRELSIRRKAIRRRDIQPPVARSEVFGIPPAWEWARLDHLILTLGDGPHFSPPYVGEAVGVPFLSTRNITADGFRLDDMKYVTPEHHAEFSKKVRPETGDVIYTKGGTTGIALVNDLSFEFSVWVHLAVLKVPQDEVYPRYLALALNSPHCYRQSQAFTHGIGNKDLGLTRMVKITVPVPPLPEQHRIVAKVDALTAICDALEARLTTTRDLHAQFAAAAVHHLDV